jgi:hypothetical protein
MCFNEVLVAILGDYLDVGAAKDFVTILTLHEHGKESVVFIEWH